MERRDGLFSRLSGEEANETAVLSMQQSHAFDFPEFFHLLSDQLIRDFFRTDVSQEESADSCVFRCWRWLAFLLNLVHDLLCDWVVDAIEALTDLFIDASVAFLQALQVLVRDVCMAVGARNPTITVSFDEEGAYVGSVPLGSFRAAQPPLSDITIVFASDG